MQMHAAELQGYLDAVVKMVNPKAKPKGQRESFVSLRRHKPEAS